MQVAVFHASGDLPVWGPFRMACELSSPGRKLYQSEKSLRESKRPLNCGGEKADAIH